MMNHFLL
jgi:hypothetical protein